MPQKKVLFISWQACLGHVTRDVPIAREMRRLRPDIELLWLASPMASRVLEEEGETLLPESLGSADYNTLAGRLTEGFGVNLVRYFRLGKPLWDANARLFAQVDAAHGFDLVVGDEIYEVLFAMVDGQLTSSTPIVALHDFIGNIPMSWNLLERLLVCVINRKAVRMLQLPGVHHLFLGQEEDILDRSGGPFLPNWRRLADQYITFANYPLRFNPADYADRAALRRQLGYGEGPVVVCALGGASIGQGLLGLCGKAYSHLTARYPDLQMVAVGGALFDPEAAHLPSAVKVYGYLPRLHEHFAACDAAVVVGGATSTHELAALQRPFIYFPLEGQYDQQIYIPARLARYGAGVRMDFRSTSGEQLAQAVHKAISEPAASHSVPLNGAAEAAEHICRML